MRPQYKFIGIAVVLTTAIFLVWWFVIRHPHDEVARILKKHDRDHAHEGRSVSMKSPVDKSQPDMAPVRVSREVSRMDPAEARQRFLERYPDKGWRFQEWPDTGWSRLEGDVFRRYAGQTADVAVMNAFRDHPELLSGLPEGATLVLDQVQDSDAGSCASILVMVDDFYYPNNLMGCASSEGVDLLKKSTPSCGELQMTCQKVDVAEAERLAQRELERRGLKNVHREPSKAPTKDLVPSPGGICAGHWTFFMNGTGKEKCTWTVKVNMCTGTFADIRKECVH